MQAPHTGSGCRYKMAAAGGAPRLPGLRTHKGEPSPDFWTSIFALSPSHRQHQNTCFVACAHMHTHLWPRFWLPPQNLLQLQGSPCKPCGEEQLMLIQRVADGGKALFLSETNSQPHGQEGQDVHGHH